MRKAIKNTIFILLLLTLSISTAFLAYLHFFAEDDRDLSGEWNASLDVTQQAAVEALNWLQDIEAVSISPEEMGVYMQDLTIQVNLTFEKTDRSAGTFHCDVMPESYAACRQKAYEAFALAFQDMLAERLRMAGYEGSMDREAVEALVTETFGMSTISYLMSYGPELLPPLEEMQAQYGGSGTYEIAENTLTRQFDVNGAVSTKVESYVRKGPSLILTEEIDAASSRIFLEDYPMVFTLEESQE